MSEPVPTDQPASPDVGPPSSQAEMPPASICTDAGAFDDDAYEHFAARVLTAREDY